MSDGVERAAATNRSLRLLASLLALDHDATDEAVLAGAVLLSGLVLRCWILEIGNQTDTVVDSSGDPSRLGNLDPWALLALSHGGGECLQQLRNLQAHPHSWLWRLSAEWRRLWDGELPRTGDASITLVPQSSVGVDDCRDWLNALRTLVERGRADLVQD